ncbi:ArsA family ATPase [Corynebacterium sp.]|uniref:ArsA family ATPase n=1 Tax=Corynebacterium sp. TaxID=1720 RepID=UPI0026DD9503|nr:ArsA family ATPase [Corynebacterium sp.]MDO5032252.1 ArsA family ATPase [Corynebacterium sp.]
MLLAPSPVMFFGGKGGVGKTTLATATALALAEQGHEVTLVSTDPAHNLGHLFGTTLGDDPTPLTPHLRAIEIDPQAATEAHLAQVGDSLRRFLPERLHGQARKHLDLARQSPGTAEAALVERIATLVSEHDAGQSAAGGSYLIFDTAPSGHTARLMALPEIMAAYTDGLLARRDKADKFADLVQGMSTSGRSSGAATAAGPVERRNQEIRSTLYARRTRFERLRAVLSSAQTTFHIVLTAERLPVLESTEFYQELTSHGIRVGSLLINRRTPAEAGEFLAARRAAEDSALELLRSRLEELPPTSVVEIPWLPYEASSLEALRELSARVCAG